MARAQRNKLNKSTFLNDSNNKKELNTLESHNFNDKLDERVVTIEGQKVKALFDSGATNNIVSEKLVSSLKNKTIIKEEKSFKLINRDVFTTKMQLH
ncbi:hypothetical protein H312_01467 [Anncaliia algerae PRA339]|uniref:Peptidase A2 domain-containing protein n=1 Tax=Anncaliia algerae PRA339 TaxID=1288291 RepID=A0A059F2D4_9MICR|nr:hypothetical protein H312_01467 [Anncaliia algerae PRA339]